MWEAIARLDAAAKQPDVADGMAAWWKVVGELSEVEEGRVYELMDQREKQEQEARRKRLSESGRLKLVWCYLNNMGGRARSHP